MYRLKKSKIIFFNTLKLFRRKKKKLPENVKEEIKTTLLSMQEHLLRKDVEASSTLAKKCELLSRLNMKKSLLERGFDFVLALGFALIVATVIRQMWFELYSIPTGSMRPTLMEQDHLVVSKAQFGVNIPLSLDHFVFDPSEVKRSGIVVFSSKDMDIPDNKMLYFYLFPGYKNLVKRLIGKPGDSLYFYGGQIYGIDKEGKEISSELNLPRLSKIAHVPFFTFEGDVKVTSKPSPTTFLYYMGLPIAKMSVTPFKQIKSDILYSGDPHMKPVEHYDELFGFKNFAHVRMLFEDGKYILEMKHSPNLKNAELARDYKGQMVPTLGTSMSYIGLNEELLRKIHGALFTDRFVVKNGYVKRESQPYPPIREGVPNRYPKITGLPDGTYEFVHGEAYKILWGGIAQKLGKTHPVAAFSPEKTFIFFNLGIEFDTAFSPDSGYNIFPSRYAFFRKNGLYLMDHEILAADDPILIKYINNELQRENSSSGGYRPFIDYGAPYLKDGGLNVDLIRQAGITVPEGHYLVLGDNYAVSSDSRKWGFVPAGNLKGVPELIFWPPSHRMGLPNQPLYELFTMPRLIVWTLGLIGFVIWRLVHRRLYHLPQSL